MRPQVGEVVNGKYRLVRLIGEGGMGSVYEARHEYLGTAVALKFLEPLLAQRQGLVARFVQEARVSAAIQSPHVVQVSDVDQTGDGLPYLVMELLEGESLQAILNRETRLPMAMALDTTIQILNGLEAAHEKGVVHRDLKPDNVVLVSTPQGMLVKLLDFGIAKLRTSHELMRGLTHPGMLMGTPEYMAPEQAFSAESVDARADLYALGVILFEMLVGRRPVSGDDPRIIAAAVLAGGVPALIDVEPSMPVGLSNAVRKALAGRPADRFSSATEMRSAFVPFCTISAPAAGVGAYPDVVAITPSPPKQGTAVFGAPAAEGPAPTAPGSDPAPAGGVSPTLPPSESEPAPPDATAVGRTGTVLGDEGGLDLGDGGDYAGTAQMAPMAFAPTSLGDQQPANFAMPPPARLRKSKSSLSILGIIAAVIGGLAAVAVIGFIVVSSQRDDDDDGPPSNLNLGATAGPVATVTPTVTTTAQPTFTATTPPVVTPPRPTSPGPGPGPTVRRDAGTITTDGGVQDGGKKDAAYPFPFPSAIPSSFLPPPIPVPSVPSGWPTLPPFPGWGPPK